MKNWEHIWPLRSRKSEKSQQQSSVEEVQDQEEDRISKLPDGILHHILASLDTNQAVQTSVLSSRWRHLVRSLPNLTFDFESFLLLQSRRRCTWSNHNPELMSRFTRSVTRFLSRREHTSAIDNFRLSSKDRSTDSTLVAKCIDYAIGHGVRHLDIDANCHPTTYASEVVGLFASETLRSLKVKQYTNSIVVPKKIPFMIMPNLKTLHLDSFEFRDDVNDLYRFPTDPFSGLLSLEELTIRDCEVSGLVIRSSTLKILEISFSHPLYSRQARMERISAPVLRSFRYQGYVSLVCAEMEILPCLEEVYFDVYAILASPYTDDVREKMVVNLVRMLQQLKLQPFRQNLVSLRWSLKLSSRYYGPYPVVEKIGAVAYRLQLPDESRIHPVFEEMHQPSHFTSATLPTTDSNGEFQIESNEMGLRFNGFWLIG